MDQIQSHSYWNSDVPGIPVNLVEWLKDLDIHDGNLKENAFQNFDI